MISHVRLVLSVLLVLSKLFLAAKILIPCAKFVRRVLQDLLLLPRALALQILSVQAVPIVRRVLLSLQLAPKPQILLVKGVRVALMELSTVLIVLTLPILFALLAARVLPDLIKPHLVPRTWTPSARHVGLRVQRELTKMFLVPIMATECVSPTPPLARTICNTSAHPVLLLVMWFTQLANKPVQKDHS